LIFIFIEFEPEHRNGEARSSGAQTCKRKKAAGSKEACTSFRIKSGKDDYNFAKRIEASVGAAESHQRHSQCHQPVGF
jgi:hypothetical protein